MENKKQTSLDREEVKLAWELKECVQRLAAGFEALAQSRLRLAETYNEIRRFEAQLSLPTIHTPGEKEVMQHERNDLYDRVAVLEAAICGLENYVEPWLVYRKEIRKREDAYRRKKEIKSGE